MDVELALKINKIIHDECKDVPHDIGLRISELVERHQAEQSLGDHKSGIPLGLPDLEKPRQSEQLVCQCEIPNIDMQGICFKCNLKTVGYIL
jgi:hypothetical protein